MYLWYLIYYTLVERNEKGALLLESEIQGVRSKDSASRREMQRCEEMGKGVVSELESERIRGRNKKYVMREGKRKRVALSGHSIICRGELPPLSLPNAGRPFRLVLVDAIGAYLARQVATL